MAHTNLGTSALSFTFSAQTLRVIMRDGEPWFVASDVCEALGINNPSQTCSRLDDDERGITTNDTPSGEQQMLVINESGLYSLILTSRKPEAKKFKKWVTAEVLPSIRKTGRYEAPVQPAQQAQAERLNGHDMAHIKRLIWLACHHMRFTGTWTQGIWFYLRQALALPYPAPLTVEHLPTIATELQRIVHATEQVNNLVAEIEREAARRIFRKGECATKVVAELETMADKRVLALEVEMRAQSLPSWMQADMRALQQRKPSTYNGHEDRAEKPTFSGEAA